MTYNQFYARAIAILPADQRDSFRSIGFAVVGVGKTIVTEWTICTAQYGHCDGQAPEECLAMLQEKVTARELRLTATDTTGLPKASGGQLPEIDPDAATVALEIGVEAMRGMEAQR